jgi:ROK family protein/MarR family protein
LKLEQIRGAPFGLRKINSQDFRIATRRTSREINRRILLNLVREHQPVSRADLARRMRLARGGVSLLVNELIAEGLVYEGAIGEAARGRKPTFLHVRTHDRMVIAGDVRFSRTDLMLSDFSGREIALETFSTVFSPKEFVRDFACRVRQLLKSNREPTNCEGLGLVVPGMVDHRSGRILNAPTLHWHNVDVREALTSATGLPVQVENAAKACVLSQMWLARDELASNYDFAFVTVSDGVGVGIVVNGELFRGHETWRASSATSRSAWTAHAVYAATWAAGRPTSQTSQPCRDIWVATLPRSIPDSFSKPTATALR